MNLAELTEKAIELLSRNGFSLMVERKRIDHAAHANDSPSVIADTGVFDGVVGIALDFARENEEILFIVIADHSTGRLTLGSGQEPWYMTEVLNGASIFFENFVLLLTKKPREWRISLRVITE